MALFTSSRALVPSRGTTAVAVDSAPLPTLPPPAPPQTTVIRERTIKRRGALGSLLFPIGVACGLVIVAVPAIGIWNIYSASEARRAVHETTIKPSGTHVETPVRRQLAAGQAEFVLKLQDGKLVRVIANQAATSDFLRSTLGYLDAARERAHAAVSTDLDRVFTEAFATRGADLVAYADWFFAWGRSWRFLYEAGTGAVQEVARLFFSKTQVTDAARNAAEDYLLRNYSELVLKPAVRDPAVAEGLRRVLRDSHRQYLVTVAGLDERLQKFLVEKTDHVEEIAPGDVAIRIDWDAEKWKAPLYRAEDRFLEPVGTVAVVGASAVLGGLIQRAMFPVVARAAAQLVTTTQMTAGGAAIGSIEPGLGTAVGALAGAGLDWLMSAFRDYMERDEFIRENSAALDSTIAAWKARLEPELIKPVDVWYDDSVAALRAMGSGAG